MTLLEPNPPNSALPLKPPLSPLPHPTSPSPLSPISPSTTSEASFLSSSSTYLDLGGAVVRDPDWPPAVSRRSIRRVYDSSSDEADDEGDDQQASAAALHPVLRTHVLHVLESGDGGVYDPWAIEADDALSLEELQVCADGVERDIERATRRRPRYVGDGLVESDEGDGAIQVHLGEDDDLADIMIGEEDVDAGSGIAAVDTLDDADLLTEIPVRGHAKPGHRRIETLEDIDVPSGIPPIANGGSGYGTVETLEDIDAPGGISPLSNGRREQGRIETLEDIDVSAGIPPLSNGKRGHRRIETLEDIDVSTGIPPLSNGTMRGHRSIETLEDFDVPTGIPPLPPGKRGHDRLDIFSDSTTTRRPVGHNRIETLDDVDLYDSPPALKRIETLPDEPLDTPVLNGVQKMRFDDILTIPIPPALPSPIDADDTPRASYSSAIEATNTPARVDTRSDASTPATSPTPFRDHHAHAERVRCSKLSELSKRVTLVTRSLASVQMLTASQAASAQATLPNTANNTRAEISHLRTTLDHLARLTLAHAHATLDAVTCHTRTHCDSQ